MEVIWSEQAKEDLKNILIFWKSHTKSNSYSQKIKKNVEQELYYITKFPNIYPNTDFKEVKRAVILNNFSLFFSINTEKLAVEVIRFWDNRRDPNDLNIS